MESIKRFAENMKSKYADVEIVTNEIKLAGEYCEVYIYTGIDMVRIYINHIAIKFNHSDIKDVQVTGNVITISTKENIFIKITKKGCK